MTLYALASSAKSMLSHFGQAVSKSLMYNIKRIGPKTLPCIIPLPTDPGEDILPFTSTTCVLSLKNACIQRSVKLYVPSDASLRIINL